MNDLNLVPVDKLPTVHSGFIDCGEIGCSANAVRLKKSVIERIYLNCGACRNLLIHEVGGGWKIKQNSREDIARRRDEAREKHEPRIGAGWQAIKKMRNAA